MFKKQNNIHIQGGVFMRIVAINKNSARGRTLALAGVLLMFYSFSALGQFPHIQLLDTLQRIGYNHFTSSACNGQDYDSSITGEFMWMSDFMMDTLFSDSNKHHCANFMYFEKGYIKLETQFDISKAEEDYCIREFNNYLHCDTFWTEEIAIQTNNNDEIIINTGIDVNVEINKSARAPYAMEPPIVSFFVEGTGSNQAFQINLENNTTYFAVFKNSANKVVNIKRIGGISNR
ncbi:MAG: hypothetical protein LBO69_02085 [Ignavibacteria bacterium]|jgi:hypothetical protein|nr:hypothetical protein [Ignavibacteria bacterium]